MNAHQRAVAGGVVWAAWTAWRVPSFQHGAWAQAMLLFAALVLVPLALELTDDQDEAGRAVWWVAWTRVAQLPAALLLAWACGLPAGGVAALAALPWVVVCGMIATAGWLRARHGGWRRSFDRLCGDLAFIFLGVGGAWVFADRAGYRPLGFDEAIVTLTAVHFHFAGLLLPLLAGLTVRAFPESRFATRAAVGVLLGVPAVAAGITAKQLGWGPAFEGAAGCGLALAGGAVAVLHVRLALEANGNANGAMVQRGLFFVAGVALFFGMALAAAYAAPGLSGATMGWLTAPWMRAVHGTINAVGFGLCGLLAWGQARR